MKPASPTPPDHDDVLRPHEYDGIQEYDKRMPNWWLYTLYAAIVFWVGYWAYYEWLRIGPTGAETVEAELAKIESARLASATIDDASLWQMSQNAAFVDAGKATYLANCAACHLASLRGKSESAAAIGPDLTDTKWLHGGKPTEIFNVIEKGVLAKGMPTWGPVLGPKKITEVTAFILSQHKEGEPVILESTAGTAGQ